MVSEVLGSNMEDNVFEIACDTLRRLYECEIFPDRQMLYQQMCAEAERDGRPVLPFLLVLDQEFWDKICHSVVPEHASLI